MAFENIPVIRSKAAFGADATRLMDEILKNPRNPAGWASTFVEVSRFARASLREGAWLALCLAIVSSQPEHVAFAGRKSINSLDGLLPHSGPALTMVWSSGRFPWHSAPAVIWKAQ